MRATVGLCSSRAITTRAGRWRPAPPPRDGRSACSSNAARETNEPAAEASSEGARPTGAHPDQLDACARIADALSSSLGADVRVRLTSGGAYRAELHFDSLDEGLELAGRLTRRPPAA